MPRQYSALTDSHRDFIARQKLFFIASAAPDNASRVNLSPKGLDSFRVLSPTSVAYLDRTGSGNETAAHTAAGGRATIMFCAFEGPPHPPLILRLYGHTRIIPRTDPDYAAFLAGHFASAEPPGARHLVLLTIDSIQTSCGFGVPLYTYQGERPLLDDWATKQGPQGLADYRRQKNMQSIDGLPTGHHEPELTE